jgi:hypothetical protein
MNYAERFRQSFVKSINELESAIINYESGKLSLQELTNAISIVAGAYRSQSLEFPRYFSRQEIELCQPRIKACAEKLFLIDGISENNSFLEKRSNLAGIDSHISDLIYHDWYKDDMALLQVKKNETERILNSLPKPSGTFMYNLILLVGFILSCLGGLKLALGLLLILVSFLLYSKNSKLKEDINNAEYKIKKLNSDIDHVIKMRG